VLLLLALYACGARPPQSEVIPRPPGPISLRFQPAPPVEGPDGTVRATVTHRGQTLPLSWTVLLRQGQSYGGLPFGSVPDHEGKPLSLGRGSMTCSGPDFNGLFDLFGKTWLLTHLECTPAALQRTRLERVQGAAFSVVDSQPSTLTVPEGTNNLCAGSVTPWISLLSGEEYETDAALLVNGSVPRQVAGKADGRDFSDNGNYPAARRYMGGESLPSPYLWGWMLESRVLDDAGTTKNEKRYALGRFSHELGVVMPDRRTVYLSDDSSHGILAMFVADEAEDLSAGTLWVSRWDGDDRGVNLGWVNLGHATDEEVRAAIDDGVRPEDLYERAPIQAGACPEGYQPNRAPQAVDECLRPRPGREILASRLETRRAAGLAGATQELSKEEGMALDAEGHYLYVATTRITSGMLADDPPFAGRDRLRLSPNPCGVVWRLDLGRGQKDLGGALIPSDWVAGVAHQAVVGRLSGDACDPSSVSEPDNLAFIPADLGSGENGVLLIGEDTDRQPNRLWAWQDGRLVELYDAPLGPTSHESPEVSGLSWVSEAGGASWITVSLQHGELGGMVGLFGPL